MSLFFSFPFFPNIQFGGVVRAVSSLMGWLRDPAANIKIFTYFGLSYFGRPCVGLMQVIFKCISQGKGDMLFLKKNLTRFAFWCSASLGFVRMLLPHGGIAQSVDR